MHHVAREIKTELAIPLHRWTRSLDLPGLGRSFADIHIEGSPQLSGYRRCTLISVQGSLSKSWKKAM